MKAVLIAGMPVIMDAHIIKSDRKRANPAKVYMDGVEFMPTGKSVLFIAKV